MKLITVFTLLLALLGFAFPTTAQDCTIDLTPVFAVLGNAQGQIAAGDTANALDNIAEARVLLEQIEAACGVSQTSTTVHKPREGRILLYVYPWDRRTTFQKLDGLAFANDYDLSVVTSSFEFGQIIQEPDIAAVIYAEPGGSNPANLQALSDFHDKGGYVFALYDRSWISNNNMLQDLFGVSVVDEMVYVGPDTDLKRLIYDSGILPAWMNGFEIGIEDDRYTDPLRLNAYLMARNPGSFEGSMMNRDGTSRLVAYSNPEGTLVFFPNISSSADYSYYFFEDQYIEQFDNQDAFLSLLKFLAG